MDQSTINFKVFEDGTEHLGVASVTLPDVNFLTQTIAGAGIGGAGGAGGSGGAGGVVVVKDDDDNLSDKIYEEYLTKLEGIAIALLCRAYEIQNGSLPENITILEDWAEESFPVDRFTNKPYELNKDTDKRLFSVGPDLTPNTKNDIRFW